MKKILSGMEATRFVDGGDYSRGATIQGNTVIFFVTQPTQVSLN